MSQPELLEKYRSYLDLVEIAGQRIIVPKPGYDEEHLANVGFDNEGNLDRIGLSILFSALARMIGSDDREVSRMFAHEAIAYIKEKIRSTGEKNGG